MSELSSIVQALVSKSGGEAEAFEGLPTKQLLTLHSRLVIGRTLRATAEAVGLRNAERARQIEAKGLRNLRKWKDHNP